jgi:hypothetical protein
MDTRFFVNEIRTYRKSGGLQIKYSLGLLYPKFMCIVVFWVIQGRNPEDGGSMFL